MTNEIKIERGNIKMKNLALIRARKLAGYTQQQIADLLQCRKSTVCNWENGRSYPRALQAHVVCRLLKRTHDEVFGESVKVIAENSPHLETALQAINERG